MDVERRMTVEQAKRHPWLTATAQSLEAHDLYHNLEEIKIFNAKRKLRTAMKTVSSRALSPPLFHAFGVVAAHVAARLFSACPLLPLRVVALTQAVARS